MLNERLWKRLLTSLFSNKSIGRYGLIGITGVILDFSIFALLISFKVNPLVATVIGTLTGILNNYVLTSRFNFKVGLETLIGIRFVGVGISGLLVSSMLFQKLMEMGIEPFYGKLMAIPIVVLMQFLVNKFWTFAKSGS